MTMPYVNQKQMSMLDKLMVRHFKISVMMMMENAGYRLAEFIRDRLPNKRHVLICCGKGNNGGDGIAAARHLHNFGYQPKIFLITRRINDEPKMHLDIAKKLKIPIFTSLEELKEELAKADIRLSYRIQSKGRTER